MACAVATVSATRSSKASKRQALARRAETLVAALLEERGFRICARKARVGRHELDIIAMRDDLLVVCEVRALRNARPVFPSETISG